MSQDKILATAELNGKYGCIDLKGKAIIPFEYDAVGLFWGNSLVPVNKGAEGGRFLPEGGKWGFCDANGVLKIALKYDKAEAFTEGLAAVSVDGKWGFINTQGEFSINPIFKKVERFSQGIAAVQNEAGKWGFINKLGQQVIDSKFDYAGVFEEGSCVVYIGEVPEEDDEYGEMYGNYGLIDINGNYLCKPLYKNIWYFSDGLAKVEVEHPQKPYGTKSGFIDRNGNLVIPTIYDFADSFHDGLAPVALAINPNFQLDTVTFINTTGEVVISEPLGYRQNFKYGYCIIDKEKPKPGKFPSCAVMDRNGNIILETKYFLEQIDTSLFIASDNKSYGKGLINLSGEVILPFSYIGLHYLGEGLFGFGGAGTGGVVDLKGKTLFKTNEFEIPCTTEKRSLTLKNNMILGRVGRIHFKFGFVDTNGKWVIPPIYDSIADFEKVN